ncbi:SDR family NAD(P)-dependent oxidoreductase [Chloroflexia bacterium SDU3-3]|nr:SDR family NAD(P)-dependent oxidoreductase [Chloroflexia bacterium SDU3-3]
MSDQKVWFITGATRGIGAEIARVVLEAGHQVVATGRSPEAVAKTLGQHENLLIAKLDVTSDEQARAAVQAAVERFGRIDVLVNNAGYGQLGWFENVSDAQIHRQFETNVFGAMSLTRLALPIMRQQRSGYVFTISSIGGLSSSAGATIYCASKFAVEGWMEGLAQEVSPLGIRTTIIEPGYFRSDFLDTSSVAYGEHKIEDYAEADQQAQASFGSMNHQQHGDPAKLGKIMIQFTEMENPPLRFLAGSDAVQLAKEKVEALRQGIEQWREQSASTDGLEREA